ncbi:RNA-DNA + DNA-DNA helicase [Escherichia phage CLB_P2]|nr:DNA helicase [Escherichia phage dhaeg]QHR72589.1 DNA helicase [Escherichia phage dhabil]UNI73276.1 RNA-DNA + DNA-DNA helicase [Escherichia phage CLB_P2]CAI9865851.1 DNA helicase [Escherichia phage UP19]
MKSFKEVIYEASIESFMSKISSCQTMDGLKELEKYYKTRSKEAELRDSDDISVRDALAGKRAELESMDDEEQEEF